MLSKHAQWQLSRLATLTFAAEQLQGCQETRLQGCQEKRLTEALGETSKSIGEKMHYS